MKLIAHLGGCPGNLPTLANGRRTSHCSFYVFVYIPGSFAEERYLALCPEACVRVVDYLPQSNRSIGSPVRHECSTKVCGLRKSSSSFIACRFTTLVAEPHRIPIIDSITAVRVMSENCALTKRKGILPVLYLCFGLWLYRHSFYVS